ncbi:glycoside hydrolase superfamily [Aspergillus alliaceus]|uniref:Probable beta-glucosidase M n=1 Tax=Petromyces alliaceus TaxID=209559 RepID=A0A5N7CNX5_PETAA|nr:glycoside hydrolase superfamily [Aspergillus alliaceus]
MAFFLRLLGADQLALIVYGQTFNNETTGELQIVLRNLERYWSCHRSPPVYPSSIGNGTGDWNIAYEQARTLVAQMTNDEKNNITYSFQSTSNGCSGNLGAVPRLGFPGLHVGVAWNPDLARKRGQYMGAEFKRKSIHIALGPVVGPLGRVAPGGGNWEGFSSDHYLCGKLAYETIVGMHNEQETDRNPSVYLATSVSSNIDNRTMHKLYPWPFQDTVKAGVGPVMCSYNRVNNSYACHNSKVLNGLLNTELGFQGYALTDWYAQHTGVASANAGLDMSMPLADSNGSMAQLRLDDMATRIVATWYNFAKIDSPEANVPVSLREPHEIVNARDPASESIIFPGAVEGHVLVKVKAALPLKKPKILSLFGYDTTATLINSQTPPFAFQQGLGSNTAAYIDALFNTFQCQAKLDGIYLSWDFYSQNLRVNTASEACIVFVNEQFSEDWDRPRLTDSYSDPLITDVAAKCNNTIIEYTNITAVIYAHIMYGKQSPSSRLPYTGAKDPGDYGTLLNPVYLDNSSMYYAQSNLTEGGYINYRHYITNNLVPRYKFGYRLIYSTFDYRDLRVQVLDLAWKSYLPPGSEFYNTTEPKPPGGLDSLWDEVATVSFTVTNTGVVDAAEVAQLVLRVFHKQTIRLGKSLDLHFHLTRRDLSQWGVVTQQWVLRQGIYKAMIGKTVLDM